MSKNVANSSEDRRVRRTRKLLWEALLKLLQERSLENISVTDICEEALLNRTTFYKHFENKYELFTYGMKYDQELFEKKLLRAATSEEGEQLSRQILETMAEHRHYYKLLLIGKEEKQLSTLLRRQIAEQMELKLEQTQREGRRFNNPLPVIAQFYAGALLALATWWLENETPISAEELAHHWSQLSRGKEPFAFDMD
ncbi:TetR/AcrR family transcriptional regulator [Ktedonosporobacter rubrisoli]|nr:TetR/AcrR family transcriptional regulator [Ktedonosporobacter rubrisoli]